MDARFPCPNHPERLYDTRVCLNAVSKDVRGDLRLLEDRPLSAQPAHMLSFGPEQMDEAIGKGAIVFPRCGCRHAVVAAPPRYLWAPLRRGQTRTTTRTGLMRHDTYVALSEVMT